MDFAKIQSAAFESLKSSMDNNQFPKGDELPRIFAEAIRKAIETYDKEKQE